MENEEKTSFWPIVGNEAAADFLEKSVKNGQLSHAYIFAGSSGVGKLSAALYFAKIIFCQNGEIASPCGECSTCSAFSLENILDNKVVHPDLFILEKGEEASISVEQARDFIEKINLSSFLGGKKIGIIKEAEKMSNAAANALLKTIEEPPQDAIIILIADSVGLLPETIVSRAQTLRFYPAPADDIYKYLIEALGVSRQDAKNFSKFSIGRPELAKSIARDKKKYSLSVEQAKIFLEFLNHQPANSFEIVEKLKKENAFKESPEYLENLLSVWESLARDILLARLGHNDLVRFQEIIGDITKQANRFEISRIASFISSLEKAKKYLSANVSPASLVFGVAAEIN